MNAETTRPAETSRRQNDNEPPRTEARCSEGGGTSGGLAALPDDAPAFLLGRAAPDAVVLAVAQGVLEAGGADRTRAADRLGRLRGVIRARVEDLGIQAPACRLLAPGQIRHGGSLPHLSGSKPPLRPYETGGAAQNDSSWDFRFLNMM